MLLPFHYALLIDYIVVLSGELFGVEYLYRQTGKALLDVMQEPSEAQTEEKQCEDIIVEEIDIGFVDDWDLDPTLPSDTRDIPRPSLSTTQRHSSESADEIITPMPHQHSATEQTEPAQSLQTLDDDGTEAVLNLAAYLATLADVNFLSAQQIHDVIRLWGLLGANDKRKIRYQPRYKPTLSKGRFAISKSRHSVLGKESVKRYLTEMLI